MGMGGLVEKNKELEKHVEMVYEKMKNVVLLNRRLRKDKDKTLIKNKELEYKLKNYEVVLEEAAGLLMTLGDPK